jgi:hypothetical protein
MNAIRKIVKRVGNELRIVLPDDFKSEEFEVIILSTDEGIEIKGQNDEESESFNRLSSEGLARAYDEEDDSFDNLKVKEPNPKYSK